MNTIERPKIQFRMLEIALAVSVWGNATGALYYVSRWLSKTVPKPNYGVLFMALIFCGLWVLEGAWWGLRRENAIRTVTKWTSRWPLFFVGWLRVPLGFLLIMVIPPFLLALILSVPRGLLTLNAGLIMVGVLAVALAIAWIWFRLIFRIRAAYQSEIVWPPKRLIAEGVTEDSGSY